MKKLPVASLLVIGAITVAILSCGQTVTEGSDTPDSDTPKLGLMKEMGVMFTGEEDHSITLAAAEQMMTVFQKDNPYKTYAWYFSRKAIEQLLAQEGCVGIRIYGGLKQDGQFSPVLFGVAPEGKDLVGGGLSKAIFDSTGVGPMEVAIPCPPYCPEPD